MFVQLPSNKALININTVKRVIKCGDGKWQVMIDVGSVIRSDIRDMYINNIDYDYLWSKLSELQ